MIRFSAQQTMPLSAGTRLGHCDVTALIGEGGMGQVCRTTDTTLHRDVENMNHSATRMASRSRCLVGSGLVFGVSAVMGLAQTAPRVTHGVATGDVTATSAIVWARSDRDALMTVSYQPVVGNTEPQEVTARTASSTNLTAQAKLEGLDPGTTYRYAVWFETAEGRSPVDAGSFRTAPSVTTRAAVTLVWAGDLGGQGYCRRIDDGYGIFRHMQAGQPDFFIANGDMIYADSTCPPTGPESGWRNVPGDFPGIGSQTVDWNDRTRVEEVYAAHWLYNRGDPLFQDFLRVTPMYVQWDDHEVINDFGAPWPAYSPTPARGGYANIVDAGRKTLFDFHPVDRHPDEPERIYRSFRWGRDVELFILDARSYRSENTLEDAPKGRKTMLGNAQLEWLKTALTQSSATWKLVSTDVPLSIPTGSNAEQNGRDAWADGLGGGFAARTGFESELLDLLRSLDQDDVRNVVFMATDVHFAAQVRYDLDVDGDGDTLLFHELVSGPLSAIRAPSPPAFDPTLHPVVLYAEGDIFNFGTIRVGDGSPAVPTLWTDVRDERGQIREGSELELTPQ